MITKKFFQKMEAMGGHLDISYKKLLQIYHNIVIIEIEWCRLRNIWPIFM